MCVTCTCTCGGGVCVRCTPEQHHSQSVAFDLADWVAGEQPNLG